MIEYELKAYLNDWVVDVETCTREDVADRLDDLLADCDHVEVVKI